VVRDHAGSPIGTCLHCKPLRTLLLTTPPPLLTPLG
jgi:hypothetical protein